MHHWRPALLECGAPAPFLEACARSAAARTSRHVSRRRAVRRSRGMSRAYWWSVAALIWSVDLLLAASLVT